MPRQPLRILAAVGILACAIAPAPALTPADRPVNPLLEIRSAAYVDGLVVITGTTAVPGAKVSIKGTDFTVTSDARKAFSFRVDWAPPGCEAELVIANQSHKKGVDGCLPAARPSGVLWTGTVTGQAGSLKFAAGGVPRYFAAGTLVAVDATFEIEANTTPGNTAEIEVAPCLKAKDSPPIVANSGPLVFAGQTGTEDVVKLALSAGKPLQRQSVSRLLHVSKGNVYQVGLCFKANTAFTVRQPVGYWAILK